MATRKISALPVLGSGSIADDNIIPIVSGSTFRTSIADLRNIFTGSGGTPGGSDTHVQFKSGSAFSGDVAFRYIYASSSLEQGNGVTASGSHSHAEGHETIALGIGSHAEGDSNEAKGNYSHAEGFETTASGSHSHAEGYQTIAMGTYQHVQGQFNLPSSAQSAFIIGNGPNGGSRSNLVFASGSQFQITGSLNVTNGITGSLYGTALSSSYINPTFISASAAASGFGSGGATFPFTGSAKITGSLTVTGSAIIRDPINELTLQVGSVNISGSAIPIAGAVVESGSYAYFAGIEKIPTIFGTSASYVSVIGTYNTASTEIYGVAALDDLVTMVYRSGSSNIQIGITSQSIEHRGNSDTGINTRFRNNSNNTLMQIDNAGYIILSQVSASFDFADDAAAATGGVPLGGLYHTSGSIKIRLA